MVKLDHITLNSISYYITDAINFFFLLKYFNILAASSSVSWKQITQIVWHTINNIEPTSQGNIKNLFSFDVT